MREINKIDPNFKSKGISPPGELKATESIEDIQTIDDSPNAIDFTGSDVLGRSQVSQVDALNKDISFGMKHPEIISKADKFFDITYNQLSSAGHKNAYEEASAMTNEYVNEFCK